MVDVVGGEVGVIGFYVPIENSVWRGEFVRGEDRNQIDNGGDQENSPAIEIFFATAFYSRRFRFCHTLKWVFFRV